MKPIEARTERGRRAPPLPSPGVRFGEGFLDRLGRLALRVRSRRERREGGGEARLLGGGMEFVGFRPYRPGEDLRRLDWNLFARHRRPFVRVSRRESSERWSVLLDRSASMGTGFPGKLQLAAEVVLGLKAAANIEGAEVDLHLMVRGEPHRHRGRGAALAEWMELLESTEARGRGGLARLLAEPGRFKDARALFLVGDLADLQPADIPRLTRSGRDILLVQVLAPEERDPSRLPEATHGDAVRWADPESTGVRTVRLDAHALAEYERGLGARLEAWRAIAAHHRVSFTTVTSDTPFEAVVERVFAR